MRSWSQGTKEASLFLRCLSKELLWDRAVSPEFLARVRFPLIGFFPLVGGVAAEIF